MVKRVVLSRHQKSMAGVQFQERHEILVTGTVEAYHQQGHPGECRTVTSCSMDGELRLVSWINSGLAALLRDSEGL